MPYPYYQQYYQPQQNFQQMQQQVQPQQMQIQNCGFVSVRNEMEARNYHVAPGNSVTFKDETAPYIYTKTMGFSQLDRPIFDKYKLVKEDVPQIAYEAHTETENITVDNLSSYVTKTEYEALTMRINDIEKNLDSLAEQMAKKPSAKVKKEDKEESEND